TSGTPAMLQELESATESGDNIVVTLWRPHWAYDAYPVRDLEDPEGAMGETEAIHATANADWAEDEANADVVGWWEDCESDSAALPPLESELCNEDPATDEYRPIIEDWVAGNQDYVDGLTD